MVGRPRQRTASALHSPIQPDSAVVLAPRVMRIATDYLVIGSGSAGLTFALEAARRGRVLVLTKRGELDAATAWAQGGIAAVLDPDDSFSEHTADTLNTGGGLSHRSIVDMVVEDAPKRIEALRELGAHF